MKDINILNQFPRKQIKPFDGMSITADVWEQAHDEHRQALLSHTAAMHGAGILAGLEVVANDPPDQFVFISPGAAIDQTGHIIIVPETVAYDFGNSAEGLLYLMLGHGEREIGGVEAETRYLQAECVIAARPALPKRPSVELARVTISRTKKSIQNAVESLHPAHNELDLRFREQVELQARQSLRVAVCHLGRQNKAVLRGWDCLAQTRQRDVQYQLIVDANPPFSENLSGYDLVYIGCSGSFKVDASVVDVLKHCLSAGTSLVLESLDNSADAICLDLLTSLEQVVEPIGEKTSLMEVPYFFARLPEGNRGHDVRISNHLVYSTAGYSLAWSGQVAGAVASRSEIRDACEWGLNLIHFCAAKGKG